MACRPGLRSRRALPRLVTQRQLLQEVWGPQYEKTNYLRVCHAQIRVKLEPDPARPRYFNTAARMGYRFEVGEAGERSESASATKESRLPL